MPLPQPDEHFEAIPAAPKRPARPARRKRSRSSMLRRLIDGLGPDMFVGLLTPEGILLEANRPALTAAGIMLADVLGRPLDEAPWFAGEERRLVRELVARAAAGESSRLDMRIQARNRPLWLDFSIQPLRDADGRVEYLVPSALVVEERKRIEREVRDSEERFRQLTDNIRDVFWMSDAGKHVMHYVSPAYETVWGRSCESLYARPRGWLEAVHPEDRRRVLDAALSQQAHDRYDEEYRIVRPDGAIRWIHDRAFAVREANGEVHRIAGIAEDITERKQSGHRLLEQQHRLEALARRLLQIQEAERRAVARELHDEVGGTLTAVRLNLLSLRAKLPEAAAGAALADSLAVVGSAMQRVRSLSLDLRPTMLDDLGLVPAVRWYCGRQQERSGVTIGLQLDAIELRAKPEFETACFRIVQESVSNALRHAASRNIDVSLRRDEHGVTLEVADDGTGFDVAATRRAALAGASGGLLGIEERVRLLGGSFRIESAAGEGTRVLVALPLAGEGAE